ncbi:MAG: Nif11 domain/cupin domain-containing protein [Cyanobacteria bacterium]|nr:Nif11 domain/cupin domain-containing protein [Cyanobacteriota bacterium]MDA0886706.1 Nif11 domain/cupin domain-containing protein [Cyanobacteriota bacterium]MDA1204995.1 Nif11 domain/cupin domain-containing protein [Cyanobacteriota bacterium]
MAEAQLQQFLEKVRQLNSFIDLSEIDPGLRQQLTDCSTHQAVVALARSRGFEIGRRWGEKTPATPNPSNLLSQACPAAGEERSEVLLKLPSWRLERIHSCQASSPPDFWYDQAEHEWVVLLQGSAQIRFEGEDRPRQLCQGDSLLISAHRRHRLVATDPDPGSIWLALFWSQACEG